MMSWLVIGLFGGLVGLDATSFPQVMISRPLVSATLTGALFGRPVEGMVIGFIMEAFALITLPIGAARYPESGTAAVAAVGAYMSSVAPGLTPGYLLAAVAVGLAWEWVAGATVVLQRRNNGHMLIREGALGPEALQRAHIAALTMDFLRGGVLAASGGLIGYGLLSLLRMGWGLPEGVTLGILTVVTATMIGTTIPLFGGARARRVSWSVGIALGLLAMVLL
jgi:mannose/fructose/N-acetylgalactosamine-specific phosphotransferase system component IIC